MTTQQLTKNDAARAGEILRRGGIVAIPTETVYGLAANALDPQAVRKIFAAKGRPVDNPLIVHIAGIDQWPPLVRELPPEALELAEVFWPGPLTIILKKSDIIPMETSGGLDTVGVRWPANPLAQAVIRAAGVPLAAPSANLSGQPSPTSFAHTFAGLQGRAEAVMDGGDCTVGVESTVLTLADGVPRLLRPGGVTLEQLRQVLGRVEVDPAVTHRLDSSAKAASPGMKYRHYAPACPVELVGGSPEEFAEYVNEKAAETPGTTALCFRETIPFLKADFLCYGSRYDSREQARLLFSALYQADRQRAVQVYAQQPGRAGVGLAVYNRLIRAAGFQEIQLPGPAVVGLVGPSGAGKSTVAAELVRLGCAVVDCDRLTRQGDVYDPACVARLRQAFGDSVAPDGVLNRRELAARAFASPEKKRLLEEITFPPIRRRVRQEIAGKSGIVILDAPTLFEAGLDSICRKILAVSAPQAERLERVIRRDGLTEAQALQRFCAQQPEEFYTCRADYVISNASAADISLQAEKILAMLRTGGEL